MGSWRGRHEAASLGLLSGRRKILRVSQQKTTRSAFVARPDELEKRQTAATLRIG